MGKGRGGIEAGYGELFFSRTYDFLEVYLVRQAGRSEHTRKSYKLGLGALYDYVTGQLAIPPGRFTFRLCTYELLLGWSQHMQGAAGLANGTVNSRLAAVRAYLRYAADGDPSLISVWLATRKVPTLPTPKRQRPVIEAGDLAAFLDAPERTRIGNRDRLVLVLPLDTAMRAAGPVGAAPGDLVLPDGEPTGQVSTLLGHQRTGTTRSHYAYPSPEQLREAVERGGGLEPNAEREWVGHEEEIKRKFGL